MLKPIAEKDVPKVLQAIRQTTSRKVLSKLLTRIKITDDEAALRQIMRLRGYSVMTNVLQDQVSNMELLALVSSFPSS
jgi:histone-lysine N-methyltransferase SETD2